MRASFETKWGSRRRERSSSPEGCAVTGGPRSPIGRSVLTVDARRGFEELRDDLEAGDAVGLGGEVRDDSMTENGGSDRLHIVRARRRTARQRGPRLRAEHEILRRARSGPPRNPVANERRRVLAGTGRPRETDRVADDVLGNGNAAHQLLQRQN